MRTTPLYTARWYRGAVRLEKNKIIPEGPFLPYDPFTYYMALKGTRRQTHSLHHRFVGINGDDPLAVLNFCKEFGVLGSHWSRVSQLIAARVKQQKDAHEELRRAGRLGQGPWKAAILQIAKREAEPCSESYSEPMTLKGFRQAQTELKDFMAQSQVVQRRDFLHVTFIRDLLSSIFAPHVLGVHPLVIWNRQAERWGFRWWGHSLEALLWLMAMLDLLGPGHLLFCDRCGAPFLGSRTNSRFCSNSCLNAFKVRKFRQQKGVKSPAKGRRPHARKSGR